ncbi:MAG: hypothetical protein EHM47_14800 [Ignavibacteriales bacterium]|nr:MAG: hypothetical protein EHM47_14800 [Ignavibacteriales bacterium]
MQSLIYKVCVQFLFALVIVTSGCRVQFVADYDENIHKEIIRISEEIDMFYTILLETLVSERTYEDFKENYLVIEVDLRSLILQNKVRPLNEESTRQAEIALELWLDDKEQHKENNSVSDFIISQHRNQFQRVFLAMAIGESVKEE